MLVILPSVHFSLRNARHPDTEVMPEHDYRNTTSKDIIICNLQWKMAHHFPHFAEKAFPCWSVLRQFPNAKRFVEVDRRSSFSKSVWITDFLKLFETAGIAVKENQPINANVTQWRVRLEDEKKVSSLFPRPNPNKPSQHFELETTGPTYFIHQDNAASLQCILLGSDYVGVRHELLPIYEFSFIGRTGVDSNGMVGTTRQWDFAEETATQIRSVWGDLVEVKVLPNPEGSLKNQALEFHRADVDLSYRLMEHIVSIVLY